MKNQTNLNSIVNLLFSTTGLIKEKIKEQHKSSTLSMPCLRTLRFIWEKGEPTMKDLADYLYITPPSVTSLIEHDVKAGFIKRLFDKKDRRIIRLAITPKGKKALRDSFKSVNIAMARILSNLEAKQIQQLKNILITIASQFESKQ